MHIRQFLCGLQFNYELAFNQHIKTMYTYHNPEILNRDLFLGFNAKAMLSEFNLERFFINTFKESWT